MMKKGFTFIEIIIVIALMAILVSIVIIVVRPGEQLERINEAKRSADISLLDTALQRYIIENRGSTPVGVDSRLRMLGTANTGCSVACAVNRAVGFTEGEFGDYIGNEFNQGDYGNTFYSSSDAGVTLSGSNEGSFTSRVFDAEDVVSWNSLLWQPLAPYGKNLPSGSIQENIYERDNADMRGNIVLLNFDEITGSDSFIDNSLQGAGGSCGSTCPTMGVSGVLNKAASFNGTTDAVVITDRAELNVTSQITLMSWVRWSINPTTGSQWTSIINKGVDSQYRLQHNSSNTAFEMAIRTSSGARWAHSTTVPQVGVWYHVVGTYDGSEIRLYVNGQLEGTASHVGNINTTTGNLFVGSRSSSDRHFNGLLDEVAIWNRALSAQEIESIYKRGVLNAEFQARSCSNSNCTGIDFTGPTGTSSYYSERGEFLNQLPQKELQGVSDNRYFQYRFFLRTTDENYLPVVRAVSLEEEFFGEVNETIDECLDLTSVLVPEYINEIPFDSRKGSADKTYYAVYKTGEGRVVVVPCFSGN